MNAAYFKKESLRNRILHPVTKQPIQWENTGADTGVKVVDQDNDKETFKALEDIANKRRMGVTRISAETYDSLKKNPLQPRVSAQQSVGQPLRIFSHDETLIKPNHSAGGANRAAADANKIVDNTPPAPPSGTPETGRPRVFQPRKAKATAVAEKAKPTTTPPASTPEQTKSA